MECWSNEPEGRSQRPEFRDRTSRFQVSSSKAIGEDSFDSLAVGFAGNDVSGAKQRQFAVNAFFEQAAGIHFGEHPILAEKTAEVIVFVVFAEATPLGPPKIIVQNGERSTLERFPKFFFGISAHPACTRDRIRLGERD